METLKAGPGNGSSAGKIAFKHYKMFLSNPLHGVSIQLITLCQYHITTEILSGPLTGMRVHWVLDIPDSYPHAPPKGAVTDGILDFFKHSHVYRHGICADFLGNFASHFSSNVGTGWTPACDMLSLMINMQVFFSEPEIEFSTEDLKRALALSNAYVCPHSDVCQYSHESFVLEMASRPSKESLPAVPVCIDVEPVFDPFKRVRSELFCSISKQNVVDETSLVLGYPINVSKDVFGRLQSILLPELISYEEYMSARQKCIQSLIDDSPFGKVNDADISMKCSTGALYTHWIPLYITEAHFLNAQKYVGSTFSVIACGSNGASKHDFKPSMIIDVLPRFMNQLIISLMKPDGIHPSHTVILAFGLLLQLLLALLEKHDLMFDVQRKVRDFKLNEQFRTKLAAGDLGEFIILMAIVGRHNKAYSFSNDTMQKYLTKEHFARQIMWISKKDPESLGVAPHETSMATSRNMTALRRLDRFWQITELSNKIHAFNHIMTEALIFDGIEATLAQGFGLIPEDKVEHFQASIKKVKALSKYEDYIELTHLHQWIQSPTDLVQIYDEAVYLSWKWKYTDTRLFFQRAW